MVASLVRQSEMPPVSSSSPSSLSIPSDEVRDGPQVPLQVSSSASTPRLVSDPSRTWDYKKLPASTPPRLVSDPPRTMGLQEALLLSFNFDAFFVSIHLSCPGFFFPYLTRRP